VIFIFHLLYDACHHPVTRPQRRDYAPIPGLKISKWFHADPLGVLEDEGLLVSIWGLQVSCRRTHSTEETRYAVSDSVIFGYFLYGTYRYAASVVDSSAVVRYRSTVIATMLNAETQQSPTDIFIMFHQVLHFLPFFSILTYAYST